MGKTGDELLALYGTPPELQVEDVSFDLSVGYQIRQTHRVLQRYLQTKIGPHGVTLGMWYFLRVLWQRDGVTQRELSHRIGIMEPTTMSAIASTERSGLVTRVRDVADRRRQLVYLTDKGKALRKDLLPQAANVIQEATAGVTMRELTLLLDLLKAIQDNLWAKLADAGEPDEEIECEARFQ